MSINKLLILIIVSLPFCCTSKKEAHNKYALPHRITDYANILTSEQEDSLTTIMEALESKVGSQIAILTIPSLEGEKIEQVSLRYAEASGLGRAKYDDGVLITFAHGDRQIRIEVGTGLENILKDEIAEKIIREDMAPRFRREKFGSGLLVAVELIAQLIEENESKVGQEPEWK